MARKPPAGATAAPPRPQDYPLNSWIPEDRSDVIQNFRPYSLNHPSDVLKTQGFVSLENYGTGIEDQARWGACVAHSIVSAMELGLVASNQSVVELSRMHLYYNARKKSNLHGQDRGCYIQDALEIAKKVGVCPEKMWGYIQDNLYKEPDVVTYKKPYKIKDYFRLPSRDIVQEIKDSLLSFQPVIFGMGVTEDYMNLKESGDYIFNPSAKNIGYHAQLIITLDEAGEYVGVRNSWSPRWGRNGISEVPFDLIKDRKWSGDFYSIILDI